MSMATPSDPAGGDPRHDERPTDMRRRQGGARCAWAACATALAAGLAGCSVDSAESRPAGGPPPPVGRLASSNPGSVNAFLLQTPRGVVVIDAGRNVAGGRRVVRETRETGRPVVAVVITHSHPDHVGGIGAIRRAYPRAPVYASRATLASMRADPLMLYDLARRDDDDFPARVTYPNRAFGPGATLSLGGLRLQTAELDSGESEAATAYYEPRARALFSGDPTSNRATPALIEGNTCGWLTNLDQLRTRFPAARTPYPGHGAPANPRAQIRRQRTYLRAVRALVRPAVRERSPARRRVSTGELGAIVDELTRRYPGYASVAALPRPKLQEANVAAVARELLAEEPASLPAACRP